MEVVKKNIKRKLIAVPCNEGGNCINLIPDTGATYSIKFLLKNPVVDLGLFKQYKDESSGKGIEIPENEYIVSGYSESRLEELKKYNVDTSYETGYKIIRKTGGYNRYTGLRDRFTGKSIRIFETIPPISEQDGIDLDLTSGSTVVYFIGGIMYVDDLVNNITTFMFTTSNEHRFTVDMDNNPIIGDDTMEELFDTPKTYSDVLIDRFDISPLKDIYKLNDVDELLTLTYYGGNYFYIKKEI
jgi:hypothetical protein